MKNVQHSRQIFHITAYTTVVSLQLIFLFISFDIRAIRFFSLFSILYRHCSNTCEVIHFVGPLTSLLLRIKNNGEAIQWPSNLFLIPFNSLIFFLSTLPSPLSLPISFLIFWWSSFSIDVCCSVWYIIFKNNFIRLKVAWTKFGSTFIFRKKKKTPLSCLSDNWIISHNSNKKKLKENQKQNEKLLKLTVN